MTWGALPPSTPWQPPCHPINGVQWTTPFAPASRHTPQIPQPGSTGGGLEDQRAYKKRKREEREEGNSPIPFPPLSPCPVTHPT